MLNKTREEEKNYYYLKQKSCRIFLVFMYMIFISCSLELLNVGIVIVRVPWHASIVLFGCWFECNFIVLELNIFSFVVVFDEWIRHTHIFCLTGNFLFCIRFKKSDNRNQIFKTWGFYHTCMHINIFYLSVYITWNCIKYSLFFVGFSLENTKKSVRAQTNHEFNFEKKFNSSHLSSVQFLWQTENW